MSLFNSTDEITCVDFDAQEPLPPRVPEPSRRFEIAMRFAGLVVMLIVAMLVGRGCGG